MQSQTIVEQPRSLKILLRAPTKLSKFLFFNPFFFKDAFNIIYNHFSQQFSFIGARLPKYELRSFDPQGSRQN